MWALVPGPRRPEHEAGAPPHLDRDRERALGRRVQEPAADVERVLLGAGREGQPPLLVEELLGRREAIRVRHRAEPRPQPRQDDLAVAGDRRLLVGAREVEHEVVQPVPEVRGDLLDVLVGVGGHQPAPVRVRLGLLGRDLHVARVVDAHLLLAGEREGRPDLRVLHRPAEVGVEGDLHLDHPVHRGRVAAGLLRALGQGRQERLGVQLRALAAGADEAVREPPGEAGGGRARGRDVDRHGLVRLVVDRRLVGAVVLALEVDELRAGRRERLDELHGLPEAREPLALLGPVDPDRDLVHGLARAHAQDHAPGREAAQGGEGLRDHRRVVAERRGEDARPEDHPRRGLGGRTQPGERVGRVAVGVAPGLEVVARPHGVEAGALGGDGEIQQASRRELLGGRLVAEGQGGHGAHPCRGRVGCLRRLSHQPVTASTTAPSTTSTEPASRRPISRRVTASCRTSTP